MRFLFFGDHVLGNVTLVKGEQLLLLILFHCSLHKAWSFAARKKRKENKRKEKGKTQQQQKKQNITIAISIWGKSPGVINSREEGDNGTDICYRRCEYFNPFLDFNMSHSRTFTPSLIARAATGCPEDLYQQLLGLRTSPCSKYLGKSHPGET